MNTDRSIMNRINEVKRIYDRNPLNGKKEAESLLRRYGKRRDNIGMTVRVMAHHMGIEK